MSDDLSGFQITVARLFFEMPSSVGFLLAGGGALLACGLTTRPTTDLDFFGRRGEARVRDVAAELAVALDERGWSSETVHETDTFVRLRIAGPEALTIDIAIDVAPTQTPTTSPVGPTFSHEELAGRKLIALFDRAAARDFADVYVLAQRFGRETLVGRAAEIDNGFDLSVLAEMMRGIARFSDDEIPVHSSAIPHLREFFAGWATELQAE